MGIARELFNLNPQKFRDTAKGKSCDEFIDYLEKQPNFRIMESLSRWDKEELYRLATQE